MDDAQLAQRFRRLEAQVALLSQKAGQRQRLEAVHLGQRGRVAGLILVLVAEQW